MQKEHINCTPSFYIQETIRKSLGKLTKDGALVVHSGTNTGRCAQDRYIVRSATTENKIWWENNLRSLTPATFESIKKKVISYMDTYADHYITERSVGASSEFNIGVKLISTHPQHALFSEHLFRPAMKPFNAATDFTILHAPLLELDAKEFNLRSGTIIATCFDTKTTIITGTLYAGEIKKSMFSVMNYVLPDHHVLPVHAGSSVTSDGVVSVFFGLSGTGKTTLSTDTGVKLLGDDEHGISDKGIFNFEGGCYAKTYKLSKESEPDIFRATETFGTMIENVTLDDESGLIDFDDKSITENGRASYSLSAIGDIIPTGVASIPKHFFFLSADAFGVLPPVAKLTHEEAMNFFVLGYTAKLAGTEVGVKEPKPTFSPCFGAPFMLRHPTVYANLLKAFLEKHNIQVWLINTGWTKGPYGVGERFPIKVTRQIIRQIQAGKVEGTATTKDEVFGLSVPNEIPGVDSKLLRPEQTWSDKELYYNKARELKTTFEEQLRKIKS